MPGDEGIAHPGDLFIVPIDHIVPDDGLIGQGVIPGKKGMDRVPDGRLGLFAQLPGLLTDQKHIMFQAFFVMTHMTLFNSFTT
jgi:hypothetical protein